MALLRTGVDPPLKPKLVTHPLNRVPLQRSAAQTKTSDISARSPSQAVATEGSPSPQASLQTVSRGGTARKTPGAPVEYYFLDLTDELNNPYGYTPSRRSSVPPAGKKRKSEEFGAERPKKAQSQSQTPKLTSPALDDVNDDSYVLIDDILADDEFQPQYSCAAVAAPQYHEDLDVHGVASSSSSTLNTVKALQSMVKFEIQDSDDEMDSQEITQSLQSCCEIETSKSPSPGNRGISTIRTAASPDERRLPITNVGNRPAILRSQDGTPGMQVTSLSGAVPPAIAVLTVDGAFLYEKYSSWSADDLSARVEHFHQQSEEAINAYVAALEDCEGDEPAEELMDRVNHFKEVFDLLEMLRSMTDQFASLNLKKKTMLAAVGNALKAG